MGIFCLVYQNKLAALASQELPEPLAQRVERHLNACPTCRSEWAAQERMAAQLRSSTPGALAPNPFLWERLEAAIQTETSVPTVSPLRRLVPLGGLALAGVALAALWVTRPASETEPQVALTITHPVSVTSPKPIQVATAAPTKSVASALEIARQSEKLPVTPQHTTDPFRKQHEDRLESTPRPLPYTVKIARRKQLPDLPVRTNHEEFSSPTQHNAVALIEVGMHRVVEESQTAELNRLVSETEQTEPGVSQRAACAPPEATAIAQNTRNLFQ